MTAAEAIRAIEGFHPGADGLAAKSRELTLGLLELSPTPFARTQFNPGHITCTALVLHPANSTVLLMHHHRLKRWLLPGGHVEESDASLSDTAAREAAEETYVSIDASHRTFLAGVDVHAIPPKGSKGRSPRHREVNEQPGPGGGAEATRFAHVLHEPEPFHLHHDLIWCFRAVSDQIETTDEAPSVLWASSDDWDRLQLADSIRNSILRAT